MSLRITDVERITVDVPFTPRCQEWNAREVWQWRISEVIRVVTDAGPTGDRRTDTLVELHDSTDAIVGSASADTSATENFLSGPITTAGDYFVVVKAGQGWAAASTKFEVIVRLE